MKWRTNLPSVGDANAFFGWCVHRDGVKGVHVPTALGLKAIFDELLPYSTADGSAGPAVGIFELFCRAHPTAKPPGRQDSVGFQARCLLMDLWPVGLTRTELNKVFIEWLPTKLGFKKSADPIQLVNKVEQGGLVGIREQFKVDGTMQVVYQIPVPLRFTGVSLAARSGSLDPLKRDGQIGLVKEYLQKFFIDVPNSKWQEGHRDPSRPLDATNAVWQPPSINGPYRNRFIFDARGLRVCPTPTEFAARTREYVADQDAAKKILDALLVAYPELRSQIVRGHGSA